MARRWHVDQVYSRDDGALVAAMNYADPDDGFAIYDSLNCKLIHKIPGPAFEPNVFGSRVFFWGDCVTTTDPDVRLCEPARVYELGGNCRPEYLARESRSLTEAIFGVGFEGRRRIEKPYSRGARFLGD